MSAGDEIRSRIRDEIEGARAKGREAKRRRDQAMGRMGGAHAMGPSGNPKIRRAMGRHQRERGQPEDS